MTSPLSITVYDPGSGGAPTTNNPRNLSGWVESYEDSLADEFGCETLRLTGKAPSIEAVIEWAQLLMASVEVDTPTGKPRFRGFLHEVQIPALEVSVSLTDLANAVIVRWSAPDGTKGTQTASNAASIARYGRKEIVLNLSSAKAAEATNRAAMVLAQVIAPPNKETVTVGDDRARPPYEVILIFRGWCEALKWLTTSNTTDTDAVTSTQVTTLITAYNTVNAFFDTANASIIATGFSATQYCDPDTTYHERVAMLLAHGNSATQRVAWGFYTRAITIATSASADPSTIAYYYSKRTGELRDAYGNVIPPWDWAPNVMVQSVDLIEPSPLSASAVATLTRKCIRRVTLRVDKEGRATGTLEADNPETLPEMLAKPVSVTPGTSARHAQIESRIIRAARVRTINTDNPNIFDETIGTLLPDGGGAPPGGAAPIGATYIVQTANATLTAEQALGALSTGILKSTTGTGVVSIASAGTDYSAPGHTHTAAESSAAPSNATYIVQTPSSGLSAEQALSLLATGILKSTTTTGVLSIAIAADLPAHASRHENGGNDELALDASQTTTGTFLPARLGSGTASSTRYLRGDSTWQLLTDITSGLPTGSGTTGRVAQWDSATDLGPATLAKIGAGVLTLSATSAFTLTAAATGPVVIGTGGAAAGVRQLAMWTGTNTLTGDAGLTFDPAGDSNLTITGGLNVGTAVGADAGNINVSAGYYVDLLPVVGNRRTGWSTATGTANRTTFNTATVIVASLAERVKALIDDLTLHGLIGP